MKYKNIKRGIFIDRPNRFIANVNIDGKVEKVHVKNTGRCKELLYEGVSVWLEKSDNSGRKTQYDLVTVNKEGTGLINIDSQAPNKAVYEWLRTQHAAEMLCGSKSEDSEYFIKPEYRYGNSRIDFYIRTKHEELLMEVKGVTLEREHMAYFPDAPTQRGIKHIDELIRAQSEGYQSFLAFVIQMQGADRVYPNNETHPQFGEALIRAREAGVRILHLGCSVTHDEMYVDRVFEYFD